MDAEKSISARLKDTRLYYDYKQTEIANALGICRNAYCEYEHYKRIIPLKRLVMLANFYEINIDYLLGLSNVIEKVKPFELDINIIRDKLLELRTINNLSVKQFANDLNISESLVYYYDSCQRLISTATCYDIAKKYNISVDYLLGRSSSKYIKK